MSRGVPQQFAHFDGVALFDRESPVVRRLEDKHDCRAEIEPPELFSSSYVESVSGWLQGLAAGREHIIGARTSIREGQVSQGIPVPQFREEGLSRLETIGSEIGLEIEMNRPKVECSDS